MYNFAVMGLDGIDSLLEPCPVWQTYLSQFHDDIALYMDPENPDDQQAILLEDKYEPSSLLYFYGNRRRPALDEPDHLAEWFPYSGQFIRLRPMDPRHTDKYVIGKDQPEHWNGYVAEVLYEHGFSKYRYADTATVNPNNTIISAMNLKAIAEACDK